MTSFKIGSPRTRKMLSLTNSGPLGGGSKADAYVGPVQPDITEYELDQFFDKKDEGSIKGFPMVPRLGSVQAPHGLCPYCDYPLEIMQDAPDNVGCGVCGRRQLRVYDPKEQNLRDDMSKMTLGNEVANVTPSLPGVPAATTNYPRQNPTF